MTDSTLFCRETKTDEMISECIEEYKLWTTARCAECTYFGNNVCENIDSCMHCLNVDASDYCCKQKV